MEGRVSMEELYGTVDRIVRMLADGCVEGMRTLMASPLWKLTPAA